MTSADIKAALESAVSDLQEFQGNMDSQKLGALATAVESLNPSAIIPALQALCPQADFSTLASRLVKISAVLRFVKNFEETGKLQRIIGLLQSFEDRRIVLAIAGLLIGKPTFIGGMNPGAQLKPT